MKPLSIRQLFLQNLAQTTDSPLMLEVKSANGSWIFDNDGKKYLDLISGISVSNLGHGNKNVKKAIKDQVDDYMHLMVYGEYIQSIQVDLATKLKELLPSNLSSVYYVNSGSEANEGALKLAKRFTGRQELIYFNKAYHGSTQGVLSVIGNEEFKRNYRPLLPECKAIEYNKESDLSKITKKTAAVIIEPIQGEAGVILPKDNFLKLLRKKCNETETILIFDEVQTGIGRTGKMFSFEHYGITPDILTLSKGFGGGMPLGAFISSQKIMSSLKNNPILGHITTFGGHPVSCAASLASLNYILDNNVLESIPKKANLFKEKLIHKGIKDFRQKGFFMAIELGSFEKVSFVIDECLKGGLIIDWFLFNDGSLRVSPPLTISEDEILFACKVLLKSLDRMSLIF